MKKTYELDKAIQIKEKKPSVNPTYNVKAGDAGEYSVRNELIDSGYPMYFLHDVQVTDDDGRSAQIDLIAVTRCIIFIIECKNFGSYVKVDSEGQFINMDENITCYSPLEQNIRHIDILTRIFPEYEDRFFPIVVFSNAVKRLDLDDAPKDLKKHIVRLEGLITRMKKVNEENKKTGVFFKTGLDALSDDEMEKYANNILAHHKEKAMPSEKKTVSQNKNISYTCPNCHNEIHREQNGFRCSGCKMLLTKVYGYELTDEQVVYLLKNPKKSIKINTDGIERIVYAEVEKKDSFIQWRSVRTGRKTVSEVPKKKKRGFVCPNCHEEVRKDAKKGYCCTADCGMRISTIYGCEIPEEQIKSLLSGKEVEVKTHYGIKMLLPTAVTNKTKDKTYIQWAEK